MAVVNNEEDEHALPSNSKRKPDLTPADEAEVEVEDESSKKQKLDTCSTVDQLEQDSDEEEEEDDDDDDDEEEEEDDDDESEDDENSSGEAVVDRKGKGIMKQDKGKGKLIEESESSIDSDNSDSDDDSDLSEDPLTEVDLNNILPARTRRRVIQPGLRISKDADDSDA